MFIACAVSITFAGQKNGECAERATNENARDPALSPARMPATVARRLRNHPGTSDFTAAYSRVSENGALASFN